MSDSSRVAARVMAVLSAPATVTEVPTHSPYRAPSLPSSVLGKYRRRGPLLSSCSVSVAQPLALLQETSQRTSPVAFALGSSSLESSSWMWGRGTGSVSSPFP